MEEFRRMIGRLTPATVYNEGCVNFVREFDGPVESLFRVFMEELGKASLNSRVKLLNFLEYGAGIVGNCIAPPGWNKLVVRNFDRLLDLAVPPHLAPPAAVNLLPAQRCLQGFHNAAFVDDVLFNELKDQLAAKKTTLKMLTETHRGTYQVTKEEVLRRMEDDRERAKKYKERELAVITGSESEFSVMWNSDTGVEPMDNVVIRYSNSQAGL